LPAFEADLGSKTVFGKTIRLNYTDVTTYYGYITPGKKPDAVIGGKSMYFLYVWIPAAAPELGLRMLSPATAYAEVKGDGVVVDADYNRDDKTQYFDTWINLERALKVVSPEDIPAKAKADWVSYGQNDDSSELPAQPSGSLYNSLLRVTSDPSAPTKALVRGLYRIAFTTYKAGQVNGTFVAQVGAPVKIPGIVIAKDLDTLLKKIKAGK
jgi:hypothetical protein